MGNFSVVTFPTGATINAFGESLDFETHPTVILATGNDLSVGTATTSVTGAAGHARLRQIGVEDSSTDPKKFRAYLYDISMKNDIPFSDVTHIFREGGGATAPIFSLTGSTGNLTASDENKLLFEAISSMADQRCKIKTIYDKKNATIKISNVKTLRGINS